MWSLLCRPAAGHQETECREDFVFGEVKGGEAANVAIEGWRIPQRQKMQYPEDQQGSLDP